MNVHEVIKYAREYLYRSMFQPGPLEEYELNRNLQYLLCQAFERLAEEFGEITKHDVAHVVEAWIVSVGTKHGRPEPLTLKNSARPKPQPTKDKNPKERE